MKKLFLLLTVLLVWGCPDPQTGKVDPYLTARTIINQAGTAVALGDGIFNQWLLTSSKPAEDKAKIHSTYLKAKTAVLNGLVLASNGVDIAEKAKKEPNLVAIMGEADKAWDSLRKFLTDLMAGDPAGVAVASKEVKPASGSTSQPSAGGISSKVSALKSKNPADVLPMKLH